MPLKAGGLYFKRKFSSEVVVPYSDLFNATEEFTLTFWAMKVYQVNTAGLMGLRYGYLRKGMFDIVEWATPNLWINFVWDDDTVSGFQIASWSAMEATWFAVVYNYRDGYVRTFKNGEQVYEYVVTKKPKPTTVDLRIGSRYFDHFTGYIWDVRFYNVALSNSEVKRIYKGESVRLEDCVLWLPMNEGYGSCVIDQSGNNNHGRIVNAKWTVEKWRGLRFEPVWGSYVEVPDSPSLRCDQNNQFTIVCFADVSKIHDIPYEKFFVMKSNDWLKGFGLWYDAGLDNIACIVFCDIITQYTAKIDRQDGLHMYAGGYDGKTVWVGLDGEWISSTTNTSGLPIMDTTGMPLRIGSNAGTRQSKCNVYAVYMWNRLLTEDELWQLYVNPDSPPARENLVLWLPLTKRHGNIVLDRSGHGNNGKVVNARWV